MRIKKELIVTVSVLTVIGCITAMVMSDNKKAEVRTKQRISQFGNSRINSISSFCHNGYSYILVRAGTHSGIAGVTNEVGENGNVKCE